MDYDYFLDEELRKLLKKPLGSLIPNDRLARELAHLLQGSRMIVSVGDVTTETLIHFGIIPSIQIVDGKEMREKRPLPRSDVNREIRTSNPAGCVTRDAIRSLASALRGKKPIRVLVEGEEDLLALPAIALSPSGTSVLYGQPRVGMVLVRVEKESRQMAFTLLERIARRRS